MCTMQIDDRFLSIKSQTESGFDVADCLIKENWDCPGDRSCMVDDLLYLGATDDAYVR